MSDGGYRQRLEHVVAAVGVAFALLAAAPIAEGVYGELRRHIAPGWRSAAARQTPVARLGEGDPIARLKVARLGLDVPVLEGVASSTLAQAPGHVPGTAIPGDSASAREAVIAISRDSPAARVTSLRLGDRFEMRTPYGTRRFRVVERRILTAAELAGGRVGRRGAHGRILFVTPYPADSAGPAPSRLGILGERS